MIQQGYVKIFRQIENWEWYTDINVFKLFMHCLIKANHKENKWRGIVIPKGSFITSYENLAFETGLTVRQVRTALDKLKSTNELTHKGQSQYSIITVNNWDNFQQDDKQNDKQMTSERQTNDKRATTNNTEKNDKHDKNDKEIKKEKESFDLFYSLCPKQKDEYKTFSLFKTLIKEKEVTADELIEGMKRYKEYTARAGTEERYIKSPLNWLRDKNWADKYEDKEVKDDKSEYNPFALL